MYLTNRPQFVSRRGWVVSGTGTPQGAVLSPFLFSPSPQPSSTSQILLFVVKLR